MSIILPEEIQLHNFNTFYFSINKLNNNESKTKIVWLENCSRINFFWNCVFIILNSSTSFKRQEDKSHWTQMFSVKIFFKFLSKDTKKLVWLHRKWFKSHSFHFFSKSTSSNAWKKVKANEIFFACCWIFHPFSFSSEFIRCHSETIPEENPMNAIKTRKKWNV